MTKIKQDKDKTRHNYGSIVYEYLSNEKFIKRYLVTFSTKIQATGTLYTVHIEFLKCTRSGRWEYFT